MSTCIGTSNLRAVLSKVISSGSPSTPDTPTPPGVEGPTFVVLLRSVREEQDNEGVYGHAYLVDEDLEVVLQKPIPSPTTGPSQEIRSKLVTAEDDQGNFFDAYSRISGQETDQWGTWDVYTNGVAKVAKDLNSNVPPPVELLDRQRLYVTGTTPNGEYLVMGWQDNS